MAAGSCELQAQCFPRLSSSSSKEPVWAEISGIARCPPACYCHLHIISRQKHICQQKCGAVRHALLDLHMADAAVAGLLGSCRSLESLHRYTRTHKAADLIHGLKAAKIT